MADAEANSFEDEEQRGKRTSVRDRGSDDVFGRMGPAGAHSRLVEVQDEGHHLVFVFVQDIDELDGDFLTVFP